MFFDSGWYGETVQNRMDDALSGKEYRRRIQSINNFERQLSDNGYLVVKFFLHIPKKIQDERFEKLLSSKNTEWRVSKADKRENKHYEEYASAWDELMDKTDTAAAPWHIIDGSERAKWLEVYRVLTKAIDAALAGERPACAPAEEKFPLLSHAAFVRRVFAARGGGRRLPLSFERGAESLGRPSQPHLPPEDTGYFGL